MKSPDLYPKLKEYFKTNNIVLFMGVNEINHEPHVYMIGPKHVAFANEHGGMLSREVIIRGEAIGGLKCAHPMCNLKYTEHKFKRVVFLQLTDNVEIPIIQKEMDGCIKLFKEYAIDGFTFVETAENYRIVEPKKPDDEKTLGDSNVGGEK